METFMCLAGKHYFIDSVATAHMHTAGCNHVVTRLYQALPLPCYKHAMCMVAQACRVQIMIQFITSLLTSKCITMLSQLCYNFGTTR